MNVSGIQQALGALVGAGPLVQRLLLVSLELAALSLAMAAVIRIARIRSPRLVCFLWLVVLAKPLVSISVGSPVALAHVDVSAPRAVVGPVSGDIANGSETMDGIEAGGEAATARTPSTVAGGPASASPAALDQVRDDVLGHWYASISLKQAMVTLWLAGVLAFLIAHLRARLRLQRFIRAAQPAFSAVTVQYRTVAAQLGLRRVPRLLVTDALESPAIVGLVRPTVLLPSWLAADAGGRKLGWAMRHELMHWRWLDPLSVFIRDAAIILFWFHPGAWWASRRLTEAMELACDRAMVRTPSDATDYAEQLFGILQNLCDRRRPAVAGGLFATRTQVGNRIAALLDGSCADAPQMTALSALGVTALAGVALAVGVAAPTVAVRHASGEPGGAARVLQFPGDRSLGMLSVLDADIKREFWADGFGYTVDSPEMRWQGLGEARGDVTVPAGKRVRLALNNESGKSLSALAKLKPDDLYELQLGKTTDDRGLTHLAHLAGLKVLDFPYPYPDNEKLPVFTAQGLRQLAKLTSLERLRTPNRMTDAGLAAIAEALPQLKVLCFGPNQVTDAGLAALSRLTRLEEITIGDGQFTNAGLAHLARLPSLHYVRLWGNAQKTGDRINDDALRQIRKIPALKTLKIPLASITDEGIAHLAGHPTLENLWLLDTKVTERGLVHLKSLPSLKILNANQRSFDRKDPPFTDIATVHLKEIKSLEYLRLAAGGVTDVGLANLAELSSLKHLDLPMPSYIDPEMYLEPYTAEGLKALSRVQSLESLSIAGPGVTDAALSYVAQLTNLRTLSFFGCPITNEGLAKLSSLKSLEKITLMGGSGPNAGQVTVSGLNCLNGLPRLTSIQADLVRDDSALNIAGLTRLEYLMLTCAKGSAFRDDDLACLANLKQLRWFQIGSFNTPQVLTDVGLAHLAGLTSLERLTIAGPGITDRGLACLVNMQRLDFLSVTGNFTDEGLGHLEGLESLRYLRIYSGTNLSSAAKARLRKNLPNLVSFSADDDRVVGGAGVAGMAAPGAARPAARPADAVRPAMAAPAAARPAMVPGAPRPGMVGATTRPAATDRTGP